MRISSAFPSQYLKAADLQGHRVKVTISHVNMEEIGGDVKPILYFQGKEKGVVLNKTNANTIANVYGDDTDDWVGQPVELFEAMVDFQGRTVAAIRVHVPRPSQRVAAPAQHPAPNDRNAYAEATGKPANGGTALNDSIPF